jgi:C-terminal processing protease CtpA/Prc
VGLFPERQNLNWSGITLQQAKIKLEWYYSPKGKQINWSGITPQKSNMKLEREYSPKGKN